MKTGKLWGVTEKLAGAPMMELHRITAWPRHQCSLHRHRHKSNLFFVLKGHLFVDVFQSDLAPPDVTRLGPNDYTIVPPGLHHRFRTGDEPCTALEIYWPEALSEDIDRKDTGGPIPDGE